MTVAGLYKNAIISTGQSVGAIFPHRAPVLQM